MARDHLGDVVSFEVTRALGRRWFWIAALLVPVVAGLIITLNVVSNTATQGEVNQQQSARFTFVYTDDSGYVSPAVATALGGRAAASGAQALAEVKSGKLAAYFAYPSNPTKEPTLVYGVDSGVFENGKYATVAKQIMIASVEARVNDPALVALVRGSFPVTTITYQQGEESGGYNAVIPPMLFVLVFYLLVVLLANQGVTSLLEEKENRVTEMILTTVNGTTLVVGKVISLFVVGAVQAALLVVPAVVAYVYFRDALMLPTVDLSHLIIEPGRMIIGALILVGGFTLFTATFVAIGAVMPTARDAGQMLAPILILSFVPLWAVSMVVSSPDSLVVQLFTFFPYTAPVTALIRNGLGTLSTAEAAVVIVELFVFGAVTLRFAVRLFRYGAVSYGRRVSVREVLAKRQ